MILQCSICPHKCRLGPGQTGICRARANLGGKIVSLNYGKVTAIALDPIEKKPLRHFYPGKKILSVGSFGCNMRCPFCQNYSISMAEQGQNQTKNYSPEELTELALDLKNKGNIGLAYTYNEPLVGYEFVYDCTQSVKKQNLKNVLITNGLICDAPFKKILPYIDAMNIDLKCFNEDYYRKLGGDLETVKETIATAIGSCHLEITNLIVPGENDSPEEMTSMVAWLATLDENIPLHISRFFPNYKVKEKGATPFKTMEALYRIAKYHLKNVYLGNV
ncbi:MAG: AmmeMemoRadiSam system radical SAM enzyme [Clostridiales bacterium]|nr:AmmeMemoRadiSam system radical SAM enzyme [Clostridiales bacterium]